MIQFSYTVYIHRSEILLSKLNDSLRKLDFELLTFIVSVVEVEQYLVCVSVVVNPRCYRKIYMYY